MNKLIATSLVAVLGHIANASAGVPGWCKDASFDTKYDLRDLSSQDVERVVITLAKATCKPSPEADAGKAQIEAARQAWGKKLLMNDADWADAVSFANVDGRPADLAYAVKDLTAMSAVDQYLTINSSIRIGRTYDFDQADYLADMFEPNLTEVGRLAYISKCIRARDAVVYAQCQGDIDAFDKAKFAVQLRSDTGHPGANKMRIRLEMYALPKKLKEQAAEVKQILAKDAAYKQLWDAAAKGRAQFASTIAQDKELLALATKLDSANWFKSRKQYEGCAEITEASLMKVISTKVPASTFKDVGRDTPFAKDDRTSDRKTVSEKVAPLLSDIPELMFVAGPYIECHGDKSSKSAFLESLFSYSPGFRGPRRAALTAITKEKVVLDDMDAQITYPRTGQPFETAYAKSSFGGVVKSVKDAEDGILVALEELLVKREECVKSHYTKKVTRVNSDGSLSYELICDQMGIVTYDDTPSDSKIDKIYKPLLKKGVQYSAVGYAVLAVWKDKNAKLPSYVLGAEVK